MKKYVLVLAAFLLFLTGCEVAKEGNYKEGTYFGTYEYEYSGQKDVATAVIYVDANGMIKSCFIAKRRGCRRCVQRHVPWE